MKTTQATSPERILVVRNRYIGDTVLAIPFLRNLRRRFPRAVIDVLVEPGAGQVLADCPYKDELVMWHRPERVNKVVPHSFANVMASARWLRSRRYDRAYILKRSFSTALLVWLAGIPHRVGFAADLRGPLLSRRVPLRRGRHEVELFLDLLRVDGIDVDDGHNENWVSPAALAKVNRLLATAPAGRPWIFVAPESTDPVKRWPAKRMAAVIRWLVTQRGGEVFFCGARDDIATHGRIRSLLGAGVAAHIHDHSLDCSLPEASALLSRMDLCIGIDTGLPHLAASFGVPVVTLFGPTDSRQWRPWGTAAAVVESTGSSRSMLDIGVEHVTAAAARLIEEAGVMERAGRRAGKAMRTLDLRTGRYRYDVIEAAAASPTAAASPG